MEQELRLVKKNKVTSAVKTLILAIIIVFCLCEEIVSVGYLCQYNDTVNITDIGHLTNNRANELIDANLISDNDIKMCFIYNAGENTVKSLSIDKNVNAEVIYINGYINMLFPDLKYAKEIDNGNCIIDMTTAVKLFGHTDVIGVKLSVDNKNYIINDVINSKQQFVIISDKNNKNLQYDQLYVNTNGESARIILNKLSVLYGIKGKMICFRVIVFLPFFLLTIMLIVSTILLIYKTRKIRYYFKNSKKRYLFYGLEFSIIIFVIALTLFFLKEIYPIDLMPTFWSAFDEWSEIIESIKSNFKLLFIKNMLFFEYSYVLYMLKSLFLAFVIYILLIIFKNGIYNNMIDFITQRQKRIITIDDLAN